MKFKNKKAIVITEPIKVVKTVINTVKSFDDISYVDVDGVRLLKCKVHKFNKDIIDSELAVCIGHACHGLLQYPKYVYSFNNKTYCTLVWHNNLAVKVDGYSYFYEVSVVDIDSILSDINFGDLTL